MWTKTNIIILIAIALLASIGWAFYQNQSTPKTGYIIIQDVYNGFEMKKEIEKKFLQTKNMRDKILDSLTFELKMLAQKINGEQEKNKSTVEQFNIKREEYLQRKKTFEEDNTALTKEYDQQILTQLNQYMKDYGESNHFAYVFGNDGNGALIYGKESLNITKEMIVYVNRRYKGL
jgi:outer membrane protein